jgi:hypothetical protein
VIKTKENLITNRKKINNAKEAGGYSMIEIEVKETKNERKENEKKPKKETQSKD